MDAEKLAGKVISETSESKLDRSAQSEFIVISFARPVSFPATLFYLFTA